LVPAGFPAAILDVDGVRVDSPHERAWRDTLDELMETSWLRSETGLPARPTASPPSSTHAEMSYKPTRVGAQAVLEHFGGPRPRIVERFYGDLLGLAAVAGWEDGVAFRVGTGVLLLSDRGRLAERRGPIADHGKSDPGHVCLRADRSEYERWRERLESARVEIVHDSDWSSGGRSFYFKDPAENLREIADCGRGSRSRAVVHVGAVAPRSCARSRRTAAS